MKIACLTDLHLDKNNIQCFKKLFDHIKSKKPKYMFFAGDFGKLSDKKIIKILKELKTFLNVRKIFYVYGNHDFFLKDIYYTKKYLTEFNKDGLIFLYNDFYNSNNEFVVIGNTYWCGLNVTNHSNKEKIEFLNKRIESLTIYSNDKLLGVKGLLKENDKSKKFILEISKQFNLPKIVLTHFPPVVECYDPRYTKPDNIKANFYLNNDKDLVKKTNPILWFCGHIHYAKKIKIKNTIIIQNSVGNNPPTDIHFDLSVITIN